ncbi:hypothetical protein M3Y96_00198300 [Aphelenchoides besseyi]|nr:hypothetical protein M3Y96_00198300 [Aphelenchoides besseyi]
MAATQNSTSLVKSTESATAQFHEKMSTLNRDLIRFLNKNEFPAADLTPTLKSYMKHVNELDRMYAGVEGEEKSSTPNELVPIVAVEKPKTTSKSDGPTIGKSRKRQLPSSNELRTFGEGKRARGAPPLKTTEPSKTSESNDSTNTVSFTMKLPTSTTTSQSTTGSLFGTTTTAQSSLTSGANVLSKPTTTIGSQSLTPSTALFGSTTSAPTQQPGSLFGSSTTVPTTTATSTGSLFGSNLFGTTTATTTAPSIKLFSANSTATTTSNQSIGSNLFGNSAATTTASSIGLLSTNATATTTSNQSLGSNLFGAPAVTKTTQSNIGSLFGQTSSVQSNAVTGANVLSKPTTTLGSQSLTPSTALFGSTTSAPTQQPGSLFGSSTTVPTTTATSTGSLFGSNLFGKPPSTTTAPSSGLFSTNSTATTTSNLLLGSNLFSKAIASNSNTSLFGSTSSQNTEESEEHPEEAPKVEDVEQKEQGALFSMKTKVFVKKDKAWEQIGVGYVNIMPGEPKKHLLVRAATTLGTIWINTLINDQFKAFKRMAPNNKPVITIRFPATVENKESGKKEILVKEYCFRAGAPAELEKLAEELSAHSIS